MPWLLRTVENLNHWHAAGFIVLSFGIGQFLNKEWPFDNFIVYQLLFIPAVVLALSETKQFLLSVNKFREVTASHPNRADGEYANALLRSPWYSVALLVVGGLFVYSSIVLHYVGFDPTGLYGLVMIIIVMASSVLGQLCYVYHIFLLRRIANGRNFKYNFYLPARTNWVQILDSTGIRLSNAFFVLGFIYTTVYCLNIRGGYVKLAFHPLKLELSTPNNAVFMGSWFVLVLIVIIAFPFYAWLRSRYMDAIVRRLKDISIEEIELLIAESGVRRDRDLDSELKYYQLIKDIDGSATRPRARTNIIPAVATISSIAVQLIIISKSF